MAKKSSNKRSGYKNKTQTAKNGKGKQSNKPRNTKGTSKRTTPQKQQPINIYIVNEKDKGGKREDKRVEEREEQAAPSKSWLDYFREWRDARLAKKQEKEQKKRVKELKASTKKVKKGTPIVKVHKPAKNNAVTSNSKGVKLRASSGGSNHSGGSIFRVLKTPLIVVLCIALLATVVYLINTKTGNKEGDWPWNIHKHYDKDGDHWCDKKGCGKCIPVDEDEDGYCDICNVCIHIDEDGDCVCDRCDNEYHEDKNRNNKCDNCGKEHLEPTNAEVAVKAVGDFFYNVTDKTFGAIRAGWDWTKDTFKDIGERIASVMPDWMLKERSDNGCEHIDENGNGVCDECLRRFREKEDTSCVHVDADNSGRCDICDAIITGTEVKPGDGDCAHVDVSPKDGKCDKCGNKVAEGEPSEPSEPDTPDTPGEPSEPDEPTVVYTVTFNPNGGILSTEETTRTTNADGTLSTMPGAYLDGYEFLGWYTLQEGGEEITLTTVFTSHTTIYAQWKEECDHIDADYNEECDICQFEWHYIHKDADLDGACDKCGYAPCVHVDEDDDGVCDKCENELCDHIDEDDNGYCDDCEAELSTDHECIYEDEDIFCDICGKPLTNAGNTGDGGNEGTDPETPEGGEGTEGDGNEGGEGTEGGGNEGAEGGEGGEGNEGTESGCNHRDYNDDGQCDKCGESYSDGCDTHLDYNDDGQCDKCGDPYEDGCNQHRDANDDGYCDVADCDKEYDDGEEECEHRDANDDGKCDNCDNDYTDETEDTLSDISNLSTLYNEYGELELNSASFEYSYKWGVDGQDLSELTAGEDLTLSTDGNFKIAILFENAYFRDYFLSNGAPSGFVFGVDESGKYFFVDFVFDYAYTTNCLYDIADIQIRTALFDKTNTDKYSKIRDKEFYIEKFPLWGSTAITDEEYDDIMWGGHFTIPVSFLSESNTGIIITVKASPRYNLSELLDETASGCVNGLKYEGETTPFRPLDFCGFTQDGKMRVYTHTKFDYIMTRIEFDGTMVYEYDEQYPFGKVVCIAIPSEENLRNRALSLTADLVEYRVNYGPVYVDDNAQVEDYSYVTIRYVLNGAEEIDLHLATVHVPILDENGDYIYDENGWNGMKCTSLFDFYFDLPEGATGSDISVWNESASTSAEYAELMLDIVTCADTWGYILYDYSEAGNIVVEIEILTDIIQMGLKNEQTTNASAS